MFKRIALTAALVATSAFAALPAAAQDYPFNPGSYVEMGGISIKDGGGFQYATYLADRWRKQQEFAKSKGWITDYKIYANVHKRDGEPDLYLVTWFPELESAAVSMARQVEWRKFVQRSDEQMAKESGDRAQYRTVMGSKLLQELRFK